MTEARKRLGADAVEWLFRIQMTAQPFVDKYCSPVRSDR
ncbi:hypothetical protein GIW70_02850 [Pseudomonas syringae]|nr:hypothetical protein [Pseudomonas syringae]MCF5067135.1 hypothetical protein [Pseudomonas syringae]